MCDEASGSAHFAGVREDVGNGDQCLDGQVVQEQTKIEDGSTKQRPKDARKISAIETYIKAPLTHLKEALMKFSDRRIKLSSSYKIIKENLDKIYEILGPQDDITLWIKENMERELLLVENVIRMDPIILVSGQVNCGKSSLINELLERSVVPVDREPCTAMMMKLKYSEEEYYMITDKQGDVGETIRKPFHAKRLKQDVEMKAAQRESASMGNVVEVGLSSVLLRYGIQIVDTPGTNENLALEEIADESIHGVLQVLIYVLDSNRAMTNVDEKKIADITRKFPDMNILYVCNKCEEDTAADELDAPSDSEEELTSSLRTRKTSKGEAVFQRLLKMGKIPEAESSTTSQHFFQLSCKELKRARHKGKVDNRYTKEFLRMIQCLIGKFRLCVRSHLQRATTTLYALSTRTFDYIISDKFLNQGVWEDLCKKMTEAEAYESSVSRQVVSFMKSRCGDIDESVKETITRRADAIIDEINEKSGEAEISVHDQETVFRTGTTEYRQTVKSHFETVITEEIVRGSKLNAILSGIQNEIKEKIGNLLADCQRINGFGDLEPQLKSCYQIDVCIEDASVFCRKMSRKSLGISLMEILNKIFENVFHSHKQGKIKTNWKKAVIRHFLKQIDDKALSAEILRILSHQLASAHSQFLSILQMIKKVHAKRECEQRNLKNLMPLFSNEICQLKAQCSTISNDDSIDLTSKREVRAGYRAEVFWCGYGRHQFAVKRLKNATKSDLLSFAEILNYSRLLNLDRPNLLVSFDPFLDPSGGLLLRMPYVQSNLFRLLYFQAKIPLVERMKIGRQVADACAYLARRSFRANDLRPNNILLNHWKPLLNLTKWKSTSVPYPTPDAKPPFHFAPEEISSGKLMCEDEGPTTHDTYSCTVLLWMLAIGKFVRPNFANTQNLKEIELVVKADVTRVQREMKAELEETKRTLVDSHDRAIVDRVDKLVSRNISWSCHRLSIDDLLHKLESMEK